MNDRQEMIPTIIWMVAVVLLFCGMLFIGVVYAVFRKAFSLLSPLTRLRFSLNEFFKKITLFVPSHVQIRTR